MLHRSTKHKFKRSMSHDQNSAHLLSLEGEGEGRGLQLERKSLVLYPGSAQLFVASNTHTGKQGRLGPKYKASYS